ncbi:MAG: hypothetical protein LBH08_02655 [Puniceicoccales bacterium]|jgi:hypothetical protein|nr:hypothetical protein [Puniceicoccales bacterium]
MSDKIEWCIVKLMDDYKWWLEKVNNDTQTDTDYVGVIDPRQFEHLVELTSPLFDYGLRNELVEGAFLKLRIVAELPDNRVKLEFMPTKIHSAEEPLFLLPNVIADNEGPYAEFIDHIIRLRVKLLNDSIDFKVPINVEEIEETLREQYQEKYIEGNNIHVFDEIVDILEYTPNGYDIANKGEFDGEGEDLGGGHEEYIVEDGGLETDESDEWDNEELQKLEILDQ